MSEIEDETGAEQTRLWNGRSGRAWIDARELLDGMFRQFEPLLAEAAAATAGEGGSVLDVGCGTGATTLALARRLGPQARCVGLDLSGPMIEVARERAAQEGLAATASFIHADAQRHAFEPDAFDAIVSRFGVMFFPDPVAAFANLRAAVRPGGVLRAIAWRAAADNHFMTTAERAAKPFLPELPPRVSDGPGQFAFADPDKVRTILGDAGWGEIALRAVDVPCVLPESALLGYLSRLGPVGAALEQVDDAAARERILTAARDAFAPFVHGDEVRFDAGCWMLEATRPGA